jgi:hypothetical protein
MVIIVPFVLPLVAHPSARLDAVIPPFAIRFTDLPSTSCGTGIPSLKTVSFGGAAFLGAGALGIGFLEAGTPSGSIGGLPISAV